jgi:hypothetical protein
VTLAFPLALLAYAAFAATRGWWPSALVAPAVAWLLWARHPRARFAAHNFLSVMVARAVLTGNWPLAVGALAAIAALQLPAARRAWPRIPRRRGLG